MSDPTGDKIPSMRARLLVLAALSAGTCLNAQSKLLTFTANLATTQTVPPSNCSVDQAACYGSATLVVDTATGAFSLNLKYTGAALGAMHLDLGDPGTNGKIQVMLEGSKAVSCGTHTWCRDILMTDGYIIPMQNIPDLTAGRDYLVVFSSTPRPIKNPDGPGAIRGQLQPVR